MLRSNSDELYLVQVGIRTILIAVERGCIKLYLNEVVILSLLCLRSLLLFACRNMNYLFWGYVKEEEFQRTIMY